LLDQTATAGRLTVAVSLIVPSVSRLTLEAPTDKLKNPFDVALLAYYAWIAARLGGWSGYTSKGIGRPVPRPWPAGSSASMPCCRAGCWLIVPHLWDSGSPQGEGEKGCGSVSSRHKRALAWGCRSATPFPIYHYSLVGWAGMTRREPIAQRCCRREQFGRWHRITDDLGHIDVGDSEPVTDDEAASRQLAVQHTEWRAQCIDCGLRPWDRASPVGSWHGDRAPGSNAARPRLRPRATTSPSCHPR
jgi:hypothetical protein